VRTGDWRRYAAPAAFLVAVTLAVALIRAGLDSGSPATGTTTIAKAPRKHVATTPTKRKRPARKARRFWTVQPGDTFGVISTKTGVPVSTIQRLNPHVSSTALFIGQKVRLR
jgi:LysM repeat protein